MLSKNFVASIVLRNFIPLRLKTDSAFSFLFPTFPGRVSVPPGRVFVGEMRFLNGFGFPSFISISLGRVPVGEMRPLAGSIGGASRLFSDP